MNVIISNKYKEMLDNLPIDIIKSNNGVFEVDDNIKEFQNYYFQRMVLDITAIKNYQDITNLQKLSINLDMDKVILVLDDSPSSMTPDYLSKLISMGIYNFTKNVEGIMYLYNHPNSYRDVAQYHQLNSVQAPIIVQQVVPGAPQQSENPNVQVQYVEQKTGPVVIGVKNLTKQSGATTLIYMMKKQLERNYSVAAIEVGKNDFHYFNEKDMVSIQGSNFTSTMSKYSDKDVVLVDVNTDTTVLGGLTDIIYLVEPSIIKLNKLTIVDPKIFTKYEGKKIILNQSLLTNKDVLDFEYEARTKVFFNMPPLDEREKNIQILNVFLTKLGFTRQKTE